jgi:drug/metabolite transporter (DMT)-like permease
MLFATPLMWLASSQIFKIDVTKDLQELLKPEHRLLLTRVGVSALVQFISFVLLYMAIAVIKPAIAIALFFTFPITSILLNWLIFGDRPTIQKWLVIATIGMGAVLTYDLISPINRPGAWGIASAILSGVTFAIYLLTSQACFRQINPVSFTAINFAVILGLSILFVPFFLSSLALAPGMLPGLLGMGLAIALTTVMGYVLTHFGTKSIGAAQALIVSASVPVLTAILAFVLLSDNLSLWQAMGICLVAGGIGWLSLQSLHRKQVRKA